MQKCTELINGHVCLSRLVKWTAIIWGRYCSYQRRAAGFGASQENGVSYSYVKNAVHV